MHKFPSFPSAVLAAVLAGMWTLVAPALAQEKEEEGHAHGPDGRHIAVAGGAASAGGASILSHHDLMITDTRKPGKDGNGEVVLGCDVQSFIHRNGDPNAVIHVEKNAFEPENGVYGSHMVYKEPGEYVLKERVAFPDKTVMLLEYPIWVPNPHKKEEAAANSPFLFVLGGLLLLALLVGVFLLGRRSGRRTAAALSVSLLLASSVPLSHAQEKEEEGHAHGPDGRHITVPGASGGAGEASEPLKAYPTADLKEFAVQTKGHYRFRLSIENEEMTPDPDLVSLSATAAQTVDLQLATAKSEPLAGSLSTSGQVRPNPNGLVTVNSRVGGRILRIGVTPGQQVRAGQVVAVLDSTEIAEAQAAYVRAQSELHQAGAARNRSLSEVRREDSKIKEAQSEWARARAEVGVTRKRVQSLRTALERQQRLASAGAFSQGPLEEAGSAVAEAEGEIRQSEAALTNQEAQVRRLEQGVAAGVTARKELEAAQTAAEQGRARVATARRQLEIARTTLAREDRLQREGLRDAREVQTARAEWEAAGLTLRSVSSAANAAENAVRTARAQSESVRSEAAEALAALVGARRGVVSARNRLRLLGATPENGSQVTVTAPLSGEVETRPVNAGEVVTAGQPLCTLLNADTVWVESDVFEKDLPRVRTGQKVKIAADAVPGRSFTGTISYVGAEVNPETRAIRVRTVVENPGEILKPNMFVRVIIASGVGSAVTIPQEALQEDGEEKVVFIREAEGTYRRRAVRAGAELGDQVVIEFGVKPGDRVVTRGAYQLLAQSKRG